MTPENLIRRLAIIKNLPVMSREDYVWAESRLDEIYDHIKKDPALLTGECLDAIAELALNSPHSDINDPDSPLHHRQTPGQDICLYAARFFMPLLCMAKREDIVSRLERIASDSLDYDIRMQAVTSLSCLSYMQDDPAENLAIALAALERVGENNSNHHIRTLARDGLLSAAREDENFVARAIEAQIKGTEDTSEEARKRAIAMLSGRVKSPTCTESEVRSLMEVFKKVAAKTPSSDEGTLRFAQEALQMAEERLVKGPGYKFP
jgi:hypothetical protein